MTSDNVRRAHSAAHQWLVAQDAAESVIESFEGEARGDEAAYAEEGRAEARRWIQRILDRQDPDGSWDGDLLATAEALDTLAEIRNAAGLREQDPGIGRGLSWLRRSRGEPGTWTDGCSPERHAMALCHHFAGGFFSPGVTDAAAGARLRNGVGVAGENEVRFVSSSAALGALLRWSAPTTDARLHLEVLRRVVSLWPASPPPELSSTALLAAVQALLRSDASADRSAAERGLAVVAGKQRADGSWADTEAFHAIEVFGEAHAAGLTSEQIRRGLWYGARLLTSTQKSDGSWGGDQAPRRALIACRTFRRAEDPAR